MGLPGAGASLRLAGQIARDGCFGHGGQGVRLERVGDAVREELHGDFMSIRAETPKAVSMMKTKDRKWRFPPPKAVNILKVKALTGTYGKVKTA